MAELAVSSYRRSFFSGGEDGSKPKTAVGSVRAGNVIGGGDFTENGLLADTMRAILKKESIYLRNPFSTRPWQYVLEPLSGYLCLAEKLLNEGHQYAQAWNFGPLQHSAISTLDIVRKLIDLWGGDKSSEIIYDHIVNEVKLHEAHNLHLNWDKSASLLDWHPVYTIDEALSETVQWYRSYEERADMTALCGRLLYNYVEQARKRKLRWSCE
jgi:CDP-glucose 4,6-dehydratase